MTLYDSINLIINPYIMRKYFRDPGVRSCLLCYTNFSASGDNSLAGDNSLSPTFAESESVVVNTRYYLVFSILYLVIMN